MASKILVLGSSSLVGSHFVDMFHDKYEISAVGRRNIFEETDFLASFLKVDLQDRTRLEDTIRSSDAEFVINYAAETNVDACERERNIIEGKVYRTNTSAVRWIQESCRETGKIFYQISTDAVFDGTKGPYSEGDPAGSISNEISWYGYTKHLAEKELMRGPSENCVIRISYPYRASFPPKTDLARTILYMHRNGNLFPLFTDQIFSPTLVDDVSKSLDFLIRRNSRGIYHVASRYQTTPFEFAGKLISVFFGDSESHKLRKASILEFRASSGSAPRPVKGGLITEKIAAEGFAPRTFEEGIMEMYRQSIRNSPNESKSV